MGWGIYSEISSGVVWVRSVGVLSCVICWRAVVILRAWAGCWLGCLGTENTAIRLGQNVEVFIFNLMIHKASARKCWFSCGACVTYQCAVLQ